MIQSSSDLNRRISDAVEKMPAFPKSVQKVLELTRDIQCDPRELVSVIEKDPVITVKILKILNSAYFGLQQKITAVNRAVVYLGLNTIKNLALNVAAMGMLPKDNKAGLDMQQYLLHSLTVAGIAKLLCSKVGKGDDPMDCHIAGLLHDFGRVAFAQFMPDEFKAVQQLVQEEGLPLTLAEQQIIGVDHAVVGAILAEKWQFPQPLVDCIRYHHDGESVNTAMAACVFAANVIGHRLSLEESGEIPEELPPNVAALCGGSLEELTAALGDLSRIVEEATLFSQMGVE